MIEIEDDEGGDAYGGKEGMSVSVIAGRDTSLVFEFSEHAFDLVALALECFAVRMLGFLVLTNTRGQERGVDEH